MVSNSCPIPWLWWELLTCAQRSRAALAAECVFLALILTDSLRGPTKAQTASRVFGGLAGAGEGAPRCGRCEGGRAAQPSPAQALEPPTPCPSPPGPRPLLGPRPGPATPLPWLLPSPGPAPRASPGPAPSRSPSPPRLLWPGLPHPPLPTASETFPAFGDEDRREEGRWWTCLFALPAWAVGLGGGWTFSFRSREGPCCAPLPCKVASSSHTVEVGALSSASRGTLISFK